MIRFGVDRDIDHPKTHCRHVSYESRPGIRFDDGISPGRGRIPDQNGSFARTHIEFRGKVPQAVADSSDRIGMQMIELFMSFLVDLFDRRTGQDVMELIQQHRLP